MKLSFGTRLRTYISNPLYQYLLFIFLADLFFLGSQPRSASNALIALGFSGYIVWTIKSSLQFGFVNTIEIQIAIPFAFASFILTYLNKINMSNHTVEIIDYTDTINLISNKIQALINEDYSCTFDRLDEQEKGWYIYLSLPFGLTPVYEDIIKKLEQELHIANSGITFEELTPQHMYFYIPNTAMRSHNEYWDHHAPWSDFHSLKERILLRQPLP